MSRYLIKYDGDEHTFMTRLHIYILDIRFILYGGECKRVYSGAIKINLVKAFSKKLKCRLAIKSILKSSYISTDRSAFKKS